jgi:hypothetical protein
LCREKNLSQETLCNAVCNAVCIVITACRAPVGGYTTPVEGYNTHVEGYTILVEGYTSPVEGWLHHPYAVVGGKTTHSENHPCTALCQAHPMQCATFIRRALGGTSSRITDGLVDCPEWCYIAGSRMFLHCTALHCTVLHCTAIQSTALHCTVLHCTAIQCTALHCTM